MPNTHSCLASNHSKSDYRVCVAEQQSTMETELERRNAELIDVRQQLESAQATVDQESKWCQTDIDELAELREELRKTVEELDVKQNEDGLLREHLQSQRAEIDALHDNVFLRFIALSIALITDLLQSSLPQNGVPNAPGGPTSCLGYFVCVLDYFLVLYLHASCIIVTQ